MLIKTFTVELGIISNSFSFASNNPEIFRDIKNKMMKAKAFTKIMVALVAVTLISTQYSTAQRSRASLGVEYGIPIGEDSTFFSGLFGGTARYEIPVGDAIGITFTFGYLSYLLKAETKGVTSGEIPVQAGFKYYFQDQQEGFYGMAEVGVHINILSFENNGTNETTLTTNMSYAPGIGYCLGESVDIGIRYQLISAEIGSASYLGFRLAYVFGGR
jgi:hypothetical protein